MEDLLLLIHAIVRSQLNFNFQRISTCHCKAFIPLMCPVWLFKNGWGGGHQACEFNFSQRRKNSDPCPPSISNLEARSLFSKSDCCHYQGFPSTWELHFWFPLLLVDKVNELKTYLFIFVAKEPHSNRFGWKWVLYHNHLMSYYIHSVQHECKFAQSNSLYNSCIIILSKTH